MSIEQLATRMHRLTRWLRSPPVAQAPRHGTQGWPARGFATDHETIAKALAFGSLRPDQRTGERLAVMFDCALALVRAEPLFDPNDSSPAVLAQRAIDIAYPAWCRRVAGLLHHVAEALPRGIEPRQDEAFLVDLWSRLRRPRAVMARIAVELGLPGQDEGALMTHEWAEIIRDNAGTQKLVALRRRLANLETFEATESAKGFDLLVSLFAGTPWLDLLRVPVTIRLPKPQRVEGMLCMGPPGSGKTQTAQIQLVQDLRDPGVRSIVIDTKGSGSLTRRLLRHAPVRPEEIALIEWHEPDMRPEINPLDLGESDPAATLMYLLAGLGRTMTGKQEMVFEGLATMAAAIRGANLGTMIELLTPAIDKYRPEIMQDPAGALCLAQVWDMDDYRETKFQVMGRLCGLRDKPGLSGLLNGSSTRLDLERIFRTCKLVIFRLKKGNNGLGNAFNLVARLNMALCSDAMLMREIGPDSPYWFGLLDEIDDLMQGMRAEYPIAKTQVQGRESRAQWMIGGQHTGQLKGDLEDAILASVAVMMLGPINKKDGAKVCDRIGMPAAVLANIAKEDDEGRMACWIGGGVLPVATIARVPFGVLESLPARSDAEVEEIRAINRRRWAGQLMPALEPEPDQDEDEGGTVIPMTLPSFARRRP